MINYIKNLFLLSLLLLLLDGCKKEEENNTVLPSVAEQVKGKWVREFTRIQYFDASGKMVFEDRNPDRNWKGYELNGTQLKITYPNDVAGYQFDYHILNRNNHQVIVYMDTLGKGEYEIISISGNKMIWQYNYPSLEYIDGSTIKIANRALYIEDLTK